MSIRIFTAASAKDDDKSLRTTVPSSRNAA